MEGCSGLAPLWHLFEVQMTGLKGNLEFITFKNGCQGMVLIFAVEKRFCNKEAFLQPISQLRNPLRNGSLAAKIEVFKLSGFRSPFRSYEMRGRGGGGGYEMALVC